MGHRSRSSIAAGMPAASSSWRSTSRLARLPITPTEAGSSPERKIASRIGRSVAWPIVMHTMWSPGRSFDT